MKEPIFKQRGEDSLLAPDAMAHYICNCRCGTAEVAVTAIHAQFTAVPTRQ